MKPRLSNPVIADRSARLAGIGFTDRLVPRRVGALPTAQDDSQACAEPAAPSDSSPDGAVFCHFTESLSVGAREEDDMVRLAPGRTIALCDHSMILLRAVANYERCSNEHAVAMALAAYATTIGAGPLARAVLDERERLEASGRPADENIPDDLGDLPEFVRRDETRFSRAREALGNSSGRMRR
ncbi:MAG: hypothetical protein EOS73_32125 [Mesorhizobium sp.]|uniref:hypothetical protein n=1 Tax=Mesorhizobium sp. M7A.F.Ca.ET.027.02.1.1 TaxID=2496655 RepID=UPI000FD4B112|nr:hypothetical protein [Mesorhizobium sp. M7A.F.Ca.ET.027.02.1.1]RVD15416.1 hypothetical protein EN749_16060 [Mesorhizobium sp. M7A.F.Ca.ET.027.02.1.1]RWC98079.1 MAG: hypothetical protein EOS73_32125 [Mesorhizobium sp.]